MIFQLWLLLLGHGVPKESPKKDIEHRFVLQVLFWGVEVFRWCFFGPKSFSGPKTPVKAAVGNLFCVEWQPAKLAAIATLPDAFFGASKPPGLLKSTVRF